MRIKKNRIGLIIGLGVCLLILKPLFLLAMDFYQSSLKIIECESESTPLYSYESFLKNQKLMGLFLNQSYEIENRGNYHISIRIKGVSKDANIWVYNYKREMNYPLIYSIKKDKSNLLDSIKNLSQFIKKRLDILYDYQILGYSDNDNRIILRTNNYNINFEELKEKEKDFFDKNYLKNKNNLLTNKYRYRKVLVKIKKDKQYNFDSKLYKYKNETYYYYDLSLSDICNLEINLVY